MMSNVQTFVLHVKASEMENVSSLKFTGTSYCISVREVGGDDVREGIHVDSTNEEEVSGSKGSMANFVMKWKDSKREASISIVAIKGLITRPITGEDVDKWVPTAVLECRGLEPYAYHPVGDWEVESTSGTKFQEVDLSEEWTDYDEKLGESVSVFKVQGKFEVWKGG